jgi:hypothetical protein
MGTGHRAQKEEEERGRQEQEQVQVQEQEQEEQQEESALTTSECSLFSRDSEDLVSFDSLTAISSYKFFRRNFNVWLLSSPVVYTKPRMHAFPACRRI